MRKRTKIIIVSALVIVIATGTVAGLYFWQNSQKQQAAEDQEVTVVELSPAEAIQELSIDDDGAVSVAAGKYGPRANELAGKLYAMNPAEWTQQEINEAHFVLEFNYKTGAYAQFEMFYQLIKGAASQGVAVDNNEFGITQAIRDEYLAELSQRLGIEPNTQDLQGAQ